ncbi:MAG: hypothetical protein WC710_15165 [Gallionella sp.]|jgi:hypothetical protein
MTEDKLKQWDDYMLAVLNCAEVGDKVRFNEERQGYTIQAKGERFIVCTKPFNLRKTVLYTIIDMKDRIRGPENLVFCAGAGTRELCNEMLARLEGRDIELGWTSEISHRNRIRLEIDDVLPARPVHL